MDSPQEKFPARRLLVAVSVAALMAAIVAPAVADPPDEPPYEISDAAREDAQLHAETTGTDITEIEHEIAYQEHVNGVIDPIIDKHWDIFSEAGFNGDGTAYVAFTDEIPEDDAAALAQVPNIELIENAALTAAEADDVVGGCPAAVHEDHNLACALQRGAGVQHLRAAMGMVIVGHSNSFGQ